MNPFDPTNTSTQKTSTPLMKDTKNLILRFFERPIIKKSSKASGVILTSLNEEYRRYKN